MKVSVLFPHGSRSTVSAEDLDELIRNNVVVAFRRSEGWVFTCCDEIRDPGRAQDSSWKDRKRAVKQRYEIVKTDG